MGFGYFIFKSSIVSTKIRETAKFRNHFLFAGMMYHGASSRAATPQYFFVCLDVLIPLFSFPEIRFEKSSIGDSDLQFAASNLFFCSYLLMCRKNFTTFTPFSESICSKALI